MEATEIKIGSLIEYNNGEVWKVQKRGLMSPYNELAKKQNVSIWIAISLVDIKEIKTTN